MYVIKFNSDGGTTISNQIVDKGNKVKRPEEPTKKGFKFEGWTLNDQIYDFESIVKKNIELKAKWEKISTSNTSSKKTSQTKDNNNISKDQQQSAISKNEVKLPTLIIIENGRGADAEGTIGMSLKLNAMEGISGIEVYSATTLNGSYTLQKTVKKEDWNNETSTIYAKKGQHLYYKVRTYVKNSAGTYYSGYSNVIELNNSN